MWHPQGGLGLDPDIRVQEAIRQIFARFRELGSARQVLLTLVEQQHCFPRPSDGRTTVSFDWTPIRYRNVISVLKKPLLRWCLCLRQKANNETEIVDGRVHKSYGHRRPMAEWEVMLKDHHEGYIDWAEFERNQAQLAANAFGWSGGAKSGRGGRALLSGLLSCGRCAPLNVSRLCWAITGQSCLFLQPATPPARARSLSEVRRRACGCRHCR